MDARCPKRGSNEQRDIENKREAGRHRRQRRPLGRDAFHGKNKAQTATTLAATSGIAIAVLDVSASAARSEAPSESQPTRPNINAAGAVTAWRWALLTSIASARVGEPLRRA
jgi:hypothetical protein